MALLPSTIVLGSTAEGVKDVILRYKGKSSEPSLASVAAYKEAAKQRDKPGLFAYTDLAALAQRMDEAGKNLGPLERAMAAASRRRPTPRPCTGRRRR